MGQYWYLTNLDSEEAINGGKLGEFFCYHATFVDINDFTVPTWPEDRLALLYRKHPRTAHKSKSPASRLLHLSDELISMILEYMDDLVDAACFCLADGRLLSIGFSRVGELQKLKFAPWAGDRVVCLGDYTDDNDYPSSLQEHVDEWLGNEDGSSCSEDGESRAFLEMILERFERRRDRPSKYSYLYRDGRMETSDFTALSTLADPEYKSSNPWVLCNLSKHEYVRADAIAGITEGEVKKSMPFLYGPISLGQALLSRICWSSDGSISMCYEGDLHRGPWAGDRFEVTTTDKLQGTEWKDISAEVAELLPKIWDAEYGDDSWRKE